MYSEIIQGITSTFGSAKLNDYSKINKNLSNFTNNRFSVSMNYVDSSIFNIDIDAHYISLVNNETTQSIDRALIKEFIKISKIDYIDVIGQTERNAMQIVSDKIKGEYTNCITNSKTGVLLQDNAGFLVEPFSGESKTFGYTNIYKIGKLYGVTIYIDPFMGWNDDIIILFDNFEINSELVDAKIVSESTFSPKLVIDYNYVFNILNSKIYYILENKSSKNYRLMITNIRDEKIDQILDDKDTFR